MKRSCLEGGREVKSATDGEGCARCTVGTFVVVDNEHGEDDEVGVNLADARVVLRALEWNVSMESWFGE